MRLIDADKLENSLKNNLQSFEEMISEHGKGIAHGTRIALKRVEEQPTISPENPQPQWIPVAERLPETSQDVLATRRRACGTARVMKAFYMSSDDGGIWASQCGTDTTGVVAWMPLPEPYTPDGEETHEANSF